MAATARRRILVLPAEAPAHADPLPVSWFAGTPWESIEALLRDVCALPRDARSVTSGAPRHLCGAQTGAFLQRVLRVWWRVRGRG